MLDQCSCYLPVLVTRAEVGPDFITKLPQEVYTTCGLASALLLVGCFFLAREIGKRQAYYDTNLAGLMKVITTMQDTNQVLSSSNGRLEALIVQTRATA